ncbi:hypothetical protein FA95DRAFT_1577781 [Auriscalpium vulgare]|uniref:Uncharacterized protein n=2 Tax=Auriscalpium vulgare TaxID=40419 RepID=A0ACB8R4Z0_9AGAM|nr:hypothetical protein FA95DRAFT_1577902 [Auriscalpium vulgare]KAI0039145.1 hypothetical protein FA95DRAFT_1577781 [Auriscalpium vulgare]
MLPPEPPGDDPPPDPGTTPDLMNVDSEDTAPILDTALEPPVLPLSLAGTAESGHLAPNATTPAVIDRLLTESDEHWMLHSLLKIPVHARACAVCTAFLTHQDPTHPSWAHVQEQYRIHRRAQFDSGVARGLAVAAERIATSEGLRRRAEENVQRLTRQRNVARESEAAAQEKISDLRAQLETIRLEHAALVQDHANATQALDRARSQPPTRPPSAASSSPESQRRRSPHSSTRKRRRTSPAPAVEGTRRSSAVRSGRAPPSWTSSTWGNIRGAQWLPWVPVTHEDVSMAFKCATTDPHAAARIRELALSASDLAVHDRTPVMRFLVQQWGTHRNTLMATPPPAPSTTTPAPSSKGGGPDSNDRSSRSSRKEQRGERPSGEPRHAPPNEWTTVAHGKRRAVNSTDVAPSRAPPQSAAAAREPAPPRQVIPEYEHPVEDWLEYYRNNPSRCPPGVPLLPSGLPLRRMMVRHLEMRLNGPQGRGQIQRSSRGHWVSRTTQLFSIRGLFGRILAARAIPVRGSIPTARPFEGDTRNLSMEDVARHFANQGYHPRSLTITELEEYAAGRRNITENRPLSSTAEWTSSPTLAEMNVLYPPVHAPAQTAGPHRNLYPNMSLDLRTASGTTRAQTPEGPSLPAHDGSLSPDFPSHYVPPTPQFLPLSDAVAGPLPVEDASWADDLYAVSNSVIASTLVGTAQLPADVEQENNVNNMSTVDSAVDPASQPLPASRSATPMDATD